MRFPRNVLALVLAGSFALVARADDYYTNNFEDPNDALVEWSNPSTQTTPGTPQHPTDRFLGQFQSQATTLTLTGLPPHSQVTVAFDLYIIGSWDGHASGSGPDIWDLSVDGAPTLIHTTFSNTGNPQTYPETYPCSGCNYSAGTGAAEGNTLGYAGSPGLYYDTVYRFPNSTREFTFSHCGESLVLVFSSNQTENHPDEKWGLDNVVISLSPPQTPGWRWTATEGDPALTVGGDIPPCGAQYDASIPAFVVDYQGGGNLPKRVWAHRTVGEFAGDFAVGGRFNCVSEGYDLTIFLAAPGFDPVTLSGQYVLAEFHNGHYDTLIGGSRNSSCFQNYDVSIDAGYPAAGDEYAFEFGRSGTSMHTAFYKSLAGMPNFIASRSWTTCDPDAALTELWIVAQDTAQGDGEARFTWLRVDGSPVGDMNCDGERNAFDIDPFVLALSNPDGYEAAYPCCDILNGDCDGDGDLNAFDIDWFVALLIGG
jgi:hypothetical protein